jgi:hypothetical protein
MASTGTAAYTVTRDELIEAAFRLLRVLNETDVPNATQIKWANVALNMLLKNMQSNGLQLWTYQLVAIPMVVGQTSYTIGPSGADVTTTRPLRLFDGSYIRDATAPTCPIDTPLRLISRLEYLQYGNKSIQAIPNSVYYQPWITSGSTTSPSTGYGTLFVYTTSQTTARTIYCNFQRPIYDMTSGTDEFDLPQEWFKCLKFMLAGDLAFEYPQVDINWARELRTEGKRLQDDLQDWSTETAPITMQPDQATLMAYRR